MLNEFLLTNSTFGTYPTQYTSISIVEGAYEHMRDPYAAIMKRVQESVLAGPGALDVEVRQHAASATDVPDELAPFVQKVTKYAYKVTDDDIAVLRQKGYSEDQIFELTVSVALGAGLSRLEAGLRAIQEER